PIAAPNYKGTVKGNGYAINGLTQPLFDVTAASFKGLHLNVKIEETVNPNVGAFARKIVATDNAPVVSNCSLRGSVVINTNITPAEADVLTDGASGGFAGIASGVHFEDCVNYASLELKQYSATTKMWGIMGGIVGYTEPANGLFTSFTNCANKGKLKYSDTTGKTAADLAGIISVYTGYKATATFDNCSNSGNIVVDENAKTRDCNIGGLVALFESAYDGSDNQNKKNISFTNNTTNSGAILVNGTVANTARIGGIIGWSDFFNTIEMNGPVTNSGRIAFTKSGKVVYLGGIMGINGSSTLNFNNFATNTESATIEMSGASTEQTYVGGFIGVSSETKNDIEPFTRIVRKTATNNANLTISGKVGGVCYFGGYVGYSYNTNTYMNKNGRFINNGILKVSETAETSGALRIGGMAGYVNGNSITAGSNNKGQVINTGKIIFEGTSKDGVQIGGLFGVHWNSVANASLSVISIGDIVATGKFNSSKVCHVGGFMGRTGSSTKIDRNIKAPSQIYCDIIAYTVAKNGDEYTFTPYKNVGMVTGNTDDDMANCANAQIGGRIATTATVVDGVVAPTWVSLTSTNYADYVFGVRNNLTEYAGASRLESKDSIVWGDYGNN
ncbi:MAG: hypothetical protein IKY57_03710, partial [Alistipes sp.]|nr:hypothetical protein [Alistipes sp.]